MIQSAPRDSQTDVIWGKLERLRNYLGDQTPDELKNITYQKLRYSPHLRTVIDHVAVVYLYKAEKAPGSFEKQYTTDRQKTIDRVASSKQSNDLKFIDEIKDTHNHNIEMLREYTAGEEGIDYKRLKEGEVDPDKINPKKLAREIRDEIKAYALREPELAKEMEDYIFKENEVDHALKVTIDDSEVKYYPGSEKGPKP